MRLHLGEPGGVGDERLDAGVGEPESQRLRRRTGPPAAGRPRRACRRATCAIGDLARLRQQDRRRGRPAPMPLPRATRWRAGSTASRRSAEGDVSTPPSAATSMIADAVRARLAPSGRRRRRRCCSAPGAASGTRRQAIIVTDIGHHGEPAAVGMAQASTRAARASSRPGASQGGGRGPISREPSEGTARDRGRPARVRCALRRGRRGDRRAAPRRGTARAGARAAHRRARAHRLVAAIRAQRGGLGGVEDLLRDYALSTREGLALMVLAEALLRVPDAATADRLIEDKLGQADWAHHAAEVRALLVSASAWALGVTARIIQPGETPESILGRSRKRLGLPAVRAADAPGDAASWATISCSARRSRTRSRARAPAPARLYRYSFDMLGEGARTAADAERYFAVLRGRHRGDRPARRQRAAAGPAGHLGQALGAASALRGASSRERVLRRARAARRRARRDRRRRTTSTSRSTPRRPTGSSCRST